MAAASVDKIMNAKYAALLANGINATSPSAHQQYIAARRSYFLTNPSNGVASVQSAFAINVPGGILSVTNNNLITISGTAGFDAKPETRNLS